MNSKTWEERWKPLKSVASYLVVNNTVTYYRGPAADIDRIEEEVLNHAPEMFQIVAKDLRARLEQASI